MRKALLALAVTVAMALTTFGETYTLKDGRVIDGAVVRTNANGSVTLRTKSGVQTYSVTEFSDETRDLHFADVQVPVVIASPRQSPPIANKKPSQKSPFLPKGAEGKTVIGLAIGGVALLVIGGLWMIIAGFAESPLWGIAFILSAGISELAFIFVHWDRAKTPLFIQVLGVALLVGAVLAAK